MTDRVRALLVTPAGELLLIRRTKSGQRPDWVLPGGGVDPGEGLEEALARELREELAATAQVRRYLFRLDSGEHRQYFYLARALTWSADAADWTGPEFADPARGQYRLEPVPLTAAALAAIDLKPDTVAGFIRDHVSAGADLFTLPDLRQLA